MTADEIRAIGCDDVQTWMTAEIAAQLATLNDTLARLAAAVEARGPKPKGAE